MAGGTYLILAPNVLELMGPLELLRHASRHTDGHPAAADQYAMTLEEAGLLLRHTDGHPAAADQYGLVARALSRDRLTAAAAGTHAGSACICGHEKAVARPADGDGLAHRAGLGPAMS